MHKGGFGPLQRRGLPHLSGHLTAKSCLGFTLCPLLFVPLLYTTEQSWPHPPDPVLQTLISTDQILLTTPPKVHSPGLSAPTRRCSMPH